MRKVIYIILTALAVLALVLLAWWWFFRQAPTQIPTNGTFGTAANSGSTNGTRATGANNVGTTLPQNGGTETQTNVQLGNVGTATGGGGVVGGVNGVPGVIWLSGVAPGTATPTNSGFPGTVFNPIGINNILDSNPTGGGVIPDIGISGNGQQGAGGGGGLGLAGTAAIAVGAGALVCGASTGISLAMQALGLTTAAGTAAAAQAPGVVTMATLMPFSVMEVNVGQVIAEVAGTTALAGTAGAGVGAENGAFSVNTFLGCIARTIAKIAIQQITNSVVNWINSGFKGSPSFVQDPSKFLTNVADNAAGTFIQSSALSFLCSPFQLQIKIAIASSYAQRNANSCTLTGIIKNINNFMAGNFLSGNWAGMIAFTTMPTNNPYGAFMFASVSLNAATSQAKGQTQTNLLQAGGFLDFKEESNCKDVGTSAPATSPGKSVKPIEVPAGTHYRVCDLKTTTPGKIIESSLSKTLDGSLDGLNLAKSFDEILGALITQLLTRTLQSGLSNLSGAGGYSSNFYSPDQLQAQDLGQALLTQMQGDVSYIQQYASIQQGSISDIENSQQQLHNLVDCWNNVASTSPKYGLAQSNAAQASSTIDALNVTINAYNDRITAANNSIIVMQQLQSQALSAGSTADVNSVTATYNTTRNSGKIPTQNDVVNAQQNRTTLQSQMNALNQQTAVKLQQCNAF
ncbi:MAG: hypothetical protein NT019_01400 [Candidatus Adlerbacteria bacterium]|nr:hypothetical protein [Candidatus Adlerbacteria bacterium]